MEAKYMQTLQWQSLRAIFIHSDSCPEYLPRSPTSESLKKTTLTTQPSAPTRKAWVTARSSANGEPNQNTGRFPPFCTKPRIFSWFRLALPHWCLQRSLGLTGKRSQPCSCISPAVGLGSSGWHNAARSCFILGLCTVSSQLRRW